MTTILVIGATGSVGRHVVAEATARGAHVRALTRDSARARRVLADVELVEGDLTNPASLAPALLGVDAVILTHGGDSAPERVYYGAVAALLEALGQRRLPIALMSSINVTHASGAYADLMNWKRRGERLLRMSGQPYAIVRPGWFVNATGSDQRLVLQQGDTRAQGGVRCDHVAQALLAAVLNPSAQGRTVEAFSMPGQPVTDWPALFAATQPHTPGGLDQARLAHSTPSTPHERSLLERAGVRGAEVNIQPLGEYTLVSDGQNWTITESGSGSAASPMNIEFGVGICKGGFLPKKGELQCRVGCME